MSYPEKGAGYRHQPKFIGRELAKEHRADGGAIGSMESSAADRGEALSEHNSAPDYFRSVDDIVKEGSNPSATSRFTSSSSRHPDKGGQAVGRRRGGTVKRADGGAVDKYDPASPGFQERNQRAAQDAADHARTNPLSDADKKRIESEVAAPKRAEGGAVTDDDDDDDGIDLAAGTEVDDSADDDLPATPADMRRRETNPTSRHRRGTHNEKD